MNYWIVKAKPSENESFDQLFRSGRICRWHSARIPKNFSKSDRVFYWKSGTGLRVIALGEVSKPFVGQDEWGKTFVLTNVTGLLPNGPDITLLRKVPIFENAVFLKAGPSGTIFSLTTEQGIWLHQWLIQKNPTASGIWADIASSDQVMDTEFELLNVREGRKFLSTHFRRERNPEIVRQKKAEFLAAHGHLFCEACHVDLRIVYGESASGAYEAHHRSLLSSAKKHGVITSTADLAILCPTCHRVIHRYNPPVSVAKFAAGLRQHA